MKKWLNENPMFFLLYCVFVIVAIVGGLLVLVGESGSLSFEEYLEKLTQFAIAVGLLGGGRAIKNGLLGKTHEDGIPPADDDVDVVGAPDEEELRTVFPDDPPRA